MASVKDALIALNITEWTMTGEPSSEAEFNSSFKKITGVDEKDRGIESSNPSDFGVTWSQITAKQKELETAYKNNKYQRDRAEAYPSIADQLDDLYHNGIDGWKTTIKAIKDKYPKG